MTVSQEKKFDEMHKIVMEMHGDMKAYKVTQDNHREGIQKISKGLADTDEVVSDIVADRNKALGAMWVGGFLGIGGFLTGLGSLVLSFFTKHS